MGRQFCLTLLDYQDQYQAKQAMSELEALFPAPGEDAKESQKNHEAFRGEKAASFGPSMEERKGASSFLNKNKIGALKKYAKQARVEEPSDKGDSMPNFGRSRSTNFGGQTSIVLKGTPAVSGGGGRQLSQQSRVDPEYH